MCVGAACWGGGSRSDLGCVFSASLSAASSHPGLCALKSRVILGSQNSCFLGKPPGLCVLTAASSRLLAHGLPYSQPPNTVLSRVLSVSRLFECPADSWNGPGEPRLCSGLLSTPLFGGVDPVPSARWLSAGFPRPLTTACSLVVLLHGSQPSRAKSVLSCRCR